MEVVRAKDVVELSIHPDGRWDPPTSESWMMVPCSECTRPIVIFSTEVRIVTPTTVIVECPYCHTMIDVLWSAGKTRRSRG